MHFSTLFSACAIFIVAMAAGAGCQSAESARHSESGTLRESGSAVSPGAQAGQPTTAILWVHGMACPQCSNNVDAQLMKVNGVEHVKVDMGSGQVTARLSAVNPPTRAQLAKAIDQTGFTLVKIEMR